MPFIDCTKSDDSPISINIDHILSIEPISSNMIAIECVTVLLVYGRINTTQVPAHKIRHEIKADLTEFTKQVKALDRVVLNATKS